MLPWCSVAVSATIICSCVLLQQLQQHFDSPTDTHTRHKITVINLKLCPQNNVLTQCGTTILMNIYGILQPIWLLAAAASGPRVWSERVSARAEAREIIECDTFLTLSKRYAVVRPLIQILRMHTWICSNVRQSFSNHMVMRIGACRHNNNNNRNALNSGTLKCSNFDNNIAYLSENGELVHELMENYNLVHINSIRQGRMELF